MGVPLASSTSASRSLRMICSGEWRMRFIGSPPALKGENDSHIGWISLRGAGEVPEIDIRKVFDALDHRHLRAILSRRVRDGVLLRLIGKWLKAGVQEDGCITRPESGSPQGGVVSPVLANAYLHEVLDTWFERAVKPRLKGRASLIRYADDAVLVFEVEGDARRVLDVLPKRFGKYGLTLHPEKTRLVPFQRPPLSAPPDAPRGGRPATFDFLGFTHHWGRPRKGKLGGERVE